MKIKIDNVEGAINDIIVNDDDISEEITANIDTQDPDNPNEVLKENLIEPKEKTTAE